jgi:hypothetical protein
MNKFIYYFIIILFSVTFVTLHPIIAWAGPKYIFKWKFEPKKIFEYELIQQIEISKQDSGKEMTYNYDRNVLIKITGIDGKSADMELMLMTSPQDLSSKSTVMNYKIHSDGKIIPLTKDNPFSSMENLLEILMSLPSSPLEVGEKYVHKILIPPRMNKFSLEGSVNINYTGNKKVMGRNCEVLEHVIDLKGTSSEESSLKGKSVSTGNGTAYFDLKGGYFVLIESEMKSKTDSIFSLGTNVQKINVKQKQKTFIKLKEIKG